MTQLAEERWLSLGRASEILGVNETTLRQWANAGRLRSFRTPGGHRRFSRDDINALLNSAGPASSDGWPQEAVARMRRQLHRRKGQPEDWATQFDEEGRARMRVLGRRLVSLATDYVTQKRRRGEMEEDARYLGLEYGRELAGVNVRLRDAIAAFSFFRGSLHDAMNKGLAGQGSVQNGSDLWNEVIGIEDTVLLGIAEAYEHA
jgi:excisionase family DNA binding protein